VFLAQLAQSASSTSSRAEQAHPPPLPTSRRHHGYLRPPPLQGKKHRVTASFIPPIKQHALSSFPLFISLVTGGIESLLHRWPLKATLHLRLPLNPIKGCPSRTLPHPTPYSLPHLSHQSALPLQVFACHHLPPSPGHLAVARSPVSGPSSSPCTTSPSPTLGHRPRALEWP
jgi:hypothetical protein